MTTEPTLVPDIHIVRLRVYFATQWSCPMANCPGFKVRYLGMCYVMYVHDACYNTRPLIPVRLPGFLPSVCSMLEILNLLN